MPRRIFLLASALLYAISLFVPVGRDEGPPRIGLEYLVLGGYFFAGFLFIPANAFFLGGWLGLALSRRRIALACGLIALALAIVGVPPLIGLNILKYPAYWFWLASFVSLVLAGFLVRTPAESVTPVVVEVQGEPTASP